jgi:anti-anti-sigma factor
MSQFEVEENELLDTSADAPTIKVRSYEGWDLVSGKVRIDASSNEELVAILKDLRTQGKRRIAIDLRGTRFMSYQAIRYCVDLARELSVIGGEFVLISPSEKTKRHFEIYGSLDRIRIVRSENSLAPHNSAHGQDSDRKLEPQAASGL